MGGLDFLERSCRVGDRLGEGAAVCGHLQCHVDRRGTGLRRSSGISLVEILVVIGILMILSAIIFAVFAPARKQARQTACVQSMKQLFHAASLYSTDYDSLTYPELGGHLAYIPVETIFESLGAYGSKKELWFCPEAPQSIRTRMSNTTLAAFVGTDEIWSKPNGEMSDMPSQRLNNIRLREKTGNDFPVVRCVVHDELHYQPHESLAKDPWLIWIRDDGSAKSGRVNWQRRTKILP